MLNMERWRMIGWKEEKIREERGGMKEKQRQKRKTKSKVKHTHSAK